MIGLGFAGLGLSGNILSGKTAAHSVPALSLDFADNTYARYGVPVTSPLSLTRSSIAWRNGADGISPVAAAINSLRRDARGAYLSRALNALNTYRTAQVGWSIVSSATRVSDTAIGLLTPVIIGSGGSTAAVLSSNTNISLTVGQKCKVIGVYKAGTSGRVRFRVSNTAALTSTVAGAAGDLVVTEEGAGPWSDILNTALGDGWFMFEGMFTAGTTEAGYRLREGPDTAVAGQTAIFAWSQISNIDGEIVLGTQSVVGSTAEDVATVDLSSYAMTGMLAKFTLGQIATDANILQMESAAGTSNVRLNVAAATGELTATTRVLGSDVATVSLATLNARQEYTVGVECRNGVLSAYIDGNAKAVVAVPGILPTLTLARLFSAGGSYAVIPAVNFYDKAIQ